MHTHFGSATNGAATFLSVVVFGTLWRIGALHLMAAGMKRNSRFMVGIGKAALFQY